MYLGVSDKYYEKQDKAYFDISYSNNYNFKYYIKTIPRVC